MKIERMIELEEEIISKDLSNKSINELLKSGYSLSDIEYLFKAILMPLNDITEMIFIYDNAWPKIDELKFTNDLCKKYNANFKTIIERIQSVRKIINYQQKVKEPSNEIKK